jgi:hypothetical protein
VCPSSVPYEICPNASCIEEVVKYILMGELKLTL